LKKNNLKISKNKNSNWKKFQKFDISKYHGILKPKKFPIRHKLNKSSQNAAFRYKMQACTLTHRCTKQKSVIVGFDIIFNSKPLASDTNINKVGFEKNFTFQNNMKNSKKFIEKWHYYIFGLFFLQQQQQQSKNANLAAAKPKARMYVWKS